MTTLRRILLADDDLHDVELTLNALTEHDLANRVDVVHDGQQALDYLRCEAEFSDRVGGDPAVVLLDLKMPRLDGHDVLRALAMDERLRMLPVVVLTSSHEERDVMESYRHNANAYVVKPVDFAEFAGAVRHLGVFWAMINEPPAS